MHKEALDLLDNLSGEDKKIVDKFFHEVYRQEREHYWSITKLFYHAMYIPMFLQIAQKYYPEQVYIDTHSGPGLAKIGGSDRDVILGSPLLALRWPKIIAENVKQFRKIEKGFTRLYYIDKDPRRISVLKRLSGEPANVNLSVGDANLLLPKIDVPGNAIVYLFVDPYGSLESQLGYEALKTFVAGKRVDLMINVLAPNIAQGLSSIRNKNTLLARIEKLFGEAFCDNRLCEKLGITQPLCNPGPKKASHILRAYWCALKRLGYRKYSILPVKFKGTILYYMVLAVKGSGKWIDGYKEFIHLHAPKDYKTLKNLWLEATGRLASLSRFLEQ